MSFSNKSVVFDGVSGYVNMGNSPTFQLEYTDAFSISCWAKTRATVTSTLVAKMDSTTGIGYSMYLNSSGQLEFILQGASTARHVRTDSSRYNDGGYLRWHTTLRRAIVRYHYCGILES